jgi:hypothetical protein
MNEKKKNFINEVENFVFIKCCMFRPERLIIRLITIYEDLYIIYNPDDGPIPSKYVAFIRTRFMTYLIQYTCYTVFMIILMICETNMDDILYIVFTVHLMTTKVVYFHTNLCTLTYNINNFIFVPIRISASQNGILRGS